MLASTIKLFHILEYRWRDTPIDDETAFAAIKASLDLVKPGEKILLSSGV